MSKNTKKTVSFPNSASSDFYGEVKKRVNAYFKDNQISPHANFQMVFKTVVLLIIYVGAYVLLMSDIFGPVGVFACFGVLGLMIALLGFNLSHDALHGAYVKSHAWNRFLGLLFDFNGTSSYVWKIHHNQEHHTFTNIHGMDNDIDKMIWFRLSPYDGRYWFHRFQHIYAPILYTFLAVRWIYFVDYPVIFDHIKQGKLPFREGAIFFGFKAANLFAFVIAPLMFLSVPWWFTVLSILFMHSVTSVVLSYVFQLAHLVDNVQHPSPNDEGVMEDDWATHEMKTTSNFATSSKLVTTLVGGLNFQVEHHLFPRICHVHYPEVQKIVKSAAEEFNIPYYEQPTFWKALKSHIKTLRMLGRGEL